jgi:hypothetical protein
VDFKEKERKELQRKKYNEYLKMQEEIVAKEYFEHKSYERLTQLLIS